MNKETLAKFVVLGVIVAGILLSRAFFIFPGAASEGLMNASSTAVVETPHFIFPQAMVSGDGAPSPAPPPAVPGRSAVAAAALPRLSATEALVMDLQAGKTLAAVKADGRWPTASLAKLMAATIVLDKLDLATKITVTPAMFAADPQEYNLVVGGRYTVLDLLHAMLLPSSNVAAEAAATFYGRDAFIAEMNARAAAWGMASTHYDDPSGISAGDESTPNDLAKLAAIIYARYPQILSISRTPQFVVTNYTTGGTFTLRSINEFAGQADFIGGKTGHTEQADGNLLSVFRDGAKPILIIVMGSNDRFGDTQKLLDWYRTRP